jgi:hypothetical protein
VLIIVWIRVIYTALGREGQKEVARRRRRAALSDPAFNLQGGGPRPGAVSDGHVEAIFSLRRARRRAMFDL